MIDSVVNKSFHPDNNNWVVSLLNIGSPYAGHAVILVEGWDNGIPYFRRCEVAEKYIPKPDNLHDRIQYTMGNFQGVISEINIYKPRSRQDLQDYLTKRDFSKYSSKSWYASPMDVKNMITSVVKSKRELGTAKSNHDPLPPYQTGGSKRSTLLGGNGGENCRTWAEKHLKIAQINVKGSWLDYIKALPEMAVKSNCSVQ